MEKHNTWVITSFLFLIDQGKFLHSHAKMPMCYQGYQMVCMNTLCFTLSEPPARKWIRQSFSFGIPAKITFLLTLNVVDLFCSSHHK